MIGRISFALFFVLLVGAEGHPHPRVGDVVVTTSLAPPITGLPPVPAAYEEAFNSTERRMAWKTTLNLNMTVAILNTQMAYVKGVIDSFSDDSNECTDLDQYLATVSSMITSLQARAAVVYTAMYSYQEPFLRSCRGAPPTQQLTCFSNYIRALNKMKDTVDSPSRDLVQQAQAVSNKFSWLIWDCLGNNEYLSF